MGLNRMMMKSNEKDIEAEMVVGYSDTWIGFMDLDSIQWGQLSPNPLPNGVRVSSVAFSPNGTQLLPATIKSCTLKELDITIMHDEVAPGYVGGYLASSINKVIPIILHF